MKTASTSNRRATLSALATTALCVAVALFFTMFYFRGEAELSEAMFPFFLKTFVVLILPVAIFSGWAAGIPEKRNSTMSESRFIALLRENDTEQPTTGARPDNAPNPNGEKNAR